MPPRGPFRPKSEHQEWLDREKQKSAAFHALRKRLHNKHKPIKKEEEDRGRRPDADADRRKRDNSGPY